MLRSPLSFDRCMSCIHNYSIVQKSSTALEVSLFHLLNPFLIPKATDKNSSVYHLYSFALYGMSYNWSHTGCHLFILASFT